MSENPNYYAILTAEVRYDKRLSPNAKLLYAEITALCGKDGKCWAKNSYFAELYEVSKKSISRWVNELVENGYIKSKIIYKKDTKEIENRYLTLSNGTDKNVNTYGQKHTEGMDKNVDTPMDKKVIDNNTRLEYYKENNKEESNSNYTNANFEEEKNIPHSFSKDEELNPKLVIEAYREKISNKYGDIQEQGSFTQISLRKNDISKMLIGIDNLAIGLKLTGKKPPKLKFWISEREYLDYQEEQVIELGKNQALVPNDLIGKSFTVDGETIKFLKDGYLKIEKDWKITNAKDVAVMVETIRTFLGGER
ncbi:helix-turn-helix domain-containing protein [Aliarcobacter butzleri]|uniref:helix-turn-helix domain-containing protein n=1 Tax=Aliarcobacter butzleri TaxID=28197 RepID=UPI002B243370|nr:helix-turn-helix domain-containing protein [Aliarcobacter butzleri]